MESSTALPSCSSWPELSPSSVINPSRPLSASTVHHSSPGSTGSLTAQTPLQPKDLTAPTNHFCYRELGNSQILLLLSEICPGMAVSHALETCRDAASVQLYQFPHPQPNPLAQWAMGRMNPCAICSLGHQHWKPMLRAISIVNILKADPSSQLPAPSDTPASTENY